MHKYKVTVSSRHESEIIIICEDGDDLDYVINEYGLDNIEDIELVSKNYSITIEK